MKIIIKEIGERVKAYDIEIPSLHRDAHLLFEPKSKTWMLDVFDSRRMNKNYAHLGDTVTIGGNEHAPNWNEAFQDIIES